MMDNMKVRSAIKIYFNNGHCLSLEENLDGKFDVTINDIDNVRIGLDIDPKCTFFITLKDLIELYKENRNG